jgi:hypothetical protein
VIDAPARGGGRFAAWVQRNFFLSMALLVAAIVAFGFGHTVEAKLIHPPFPRPAILFVHVAMFTAWVLLFITQTALVRAGNVRWHKRLGIFGIALGTPMPVVGAMTAVTMARLNTQHGDADAARFLVLPIFYMFAFAVLFGSAVLLRKKPEFHRRLMFMATCTLTVAAFARFPGLPIGAWDVCVDILIVLGIARDLILTRSVHAVYRYVFPALIAGQILANYLYFSASPAWLAIAHTMMLR